MFVSYIHTTNICAYFHLFVFFSSPMASQSTSGQPLPVIIHHPFRWKTSSIRYHVAWSSLLPRLRPRTRPIMNWIQLDARGKGSRNSPQYPSILFVDL